MIKNTSKKIFIITGATRGLGKELAFKLVSDKDASLFLIGRDKTKAIIQEIKDKGALVSGFVVDLVNAESLEKVMNEIFSLISFKNSGSIVLINNAATLFPINLAGNYSSISAINNMKVNCLAPIVLSAIFIEKTKEWSGNKLIINISSGAASIPIEGWSLYCSSKAAIEMFTQVVSKEQKRFESGVGIYSFDPGALDTDMQFEVRKKTKDEFPAVDNFIELCNSGALREPKEVASEIIDFVVKKIGQSK